MKVVKNSLKKRIYKIMKKLDKKLALNEKNDKSYEQMLEVAQFGVLKFGKISVPFLMRKLKCSALMAKVIIMHVEEFEKIRLSAS